MTLLNFLDRIKDNRLEFHSQFTKSGRSEVVDVSEVVL